MASWVAPSIAAEIWQTSVTEIVRRACQGELQTKNEGGFLFVNVDPHPDPIDNSVKPATFSLVTDEERSALFEPLEIGTARKLIGETRKRPLAA
ncbi:hypothetical protein BH10PLA1_BH10PLA1_00050 [soil metagenome]